MRRSVVSPEKFRGKTSEKGGRLMTLEIIKEKTGKRKGNARYFIAHTAKSFAFSAMSRVGVPRTGRKFPSEGRGKRRP